jgi:hypothetical protein
VKHFITHYHYPSIDVPESQGATSAGGQSPSPSSGYRGGAGAGSERREHGLAVLARGGAAVQEAFDCMTHASFVGLVWEAYDAGWLTGAGASLSAAGDVEWEWWVGDGPLLGKYVG